MVHTVRMRSQFSTFDVSKMFQIDRTRLQQWLDDGFFKPYQTAKGKGTKAIFTRDDLYRLRLFILLQKHGYSRQEAHDYSNIEFSNVGRRSDQLKYGVVTESLVRGLVKSGKFEVTAEKPEIEDSIAYTLVINLQAIKDEVDSVLGE